MPRIPDQLLHSIVFIYPDEHSARQGSAAGGTGFLVDLVSDVSGLAYRYLVTNAHVVQNETRFVRINMTNGGVDVLEIPRASWVSHPDGDDVAAAAILISDPKWDIGALKWTDFVGDILTWQQRVKELNIGIGDDVFMLGRFISHDGKERNQPLARFGNIGMMPGEPVLDGRQLRVEAYLVEMRSLSGFSGSPVFVYLGPGTYRGDRRMMPFYSETIGLLGIDTGHKLLTSEIIERGTGQPVNSEWVVMQSTAISIVAPNKKIQEVLDDERFMKQRAEKDVG